MSKHRKNRGFDQYMQPPMFNPGNMPPNMVPPNMNMGNNMNPGMNMPPNMNQGVGMPPNMNMGNNMGQGMNMPPNMGNMAQAMGNGFNMNNNNPMQALLGALTGMGGGNGGIPGMNNPLMDMLKNGGGDMSQFVNLFNALKTNGVNLNNVNTNGIDLDDQGDRNNNIDVSDDSTIQLLASLKPFLPPKGIQAIDKVIELYRDGDFEE